jgi:hypothetical protein
VRPQVLDRYFAALTRFQERPQPHVFPEAVRNTGVQLDSDFSAASLGLDHQRQGNELATRVLCCDLPLRKS